MSDLLAIVHNLNRLATLGRTGLLDTPAEAPFDRLTRLATRLLKAPVALVSLVDRDRQFFKSAIGLPEPWQTRRETPLTHSFCQHVVAQHEPLIIPDARKDPKFRDNPRRARSQHRRVRRHSFDDGGVSVGFVLRD